MRKTLKKGFPHSGERLLMNKEMFEDCWQTEELEECWVPPADRSSSFQHFTEQQQSVVASKAILKWFLFLFDSSGCLYGLLYCLLDFFHNFTFLLFIKYCSFSLVVEKMDNVTGGLETSHRRYTEKLTEVESDLKKLGNLHKQNPFLLWLWGVLLADSGRKFVWKNFWLWQDTACLFQFHKYLGKHLKIVKISST